MTTQLPLFLVSSPIGIHIRDFEAFMQSSLVVPVSSNPEQLSWASENARMQVVAMYGFPGDLADAPKGLLQATDILIYNKSRENDRMCAACMRWYRAGEGFKSYSSLEEFLVRPVLERPEVDAETASEQDLSGICTRQCMQALKGGSDAVFGKHADELSAGEVATMTPGPGGVRCRKPTAGESAQGAKLVFFSE